MENENNVIFNDETIEKNDELVYPNYNFKVLKEPNKRLLHSKSFIVFISVLLFSVACISYLIFLLVDTPNYVLIFNNKEISDTENEEYIYTYDNYSLFNGVFKESNNTYLKTDISDHIFTFKKEKFHELNNNYNDFSFSVSFEMATEFLNYDYSFSYLTFNNSKKELRRELISTSYGVSLTYYKYTFYDLEFKKYDEITLDFYNVLNTYKTNNDPKFYFRNMKLIIYGA